MTACVACGAEGSDDRCGVCGVARRVGRFEVERVIDSSARDRTYAARAPDGAEVVVAEVRFDAAPSGVELARVEDAFAALLGLEAPGLPRFVERLAIGEGLATRAYLVEERVVGPTLEALSSTRSLAEAETLEIARAALATLALLEQTTPSIVHGALDLDHLVRGPSGALVLTRFGRGRALAGEPGRGASPDLVGLGAALARLLDRAEGPISPRTLAFVRALRALVDGERFTSAQAAARALDDPGWPRRARSGLAITLVGTLACALLGAAAARGRTVEPAPDASPATTERAPAAPARASMLGLGRGNGRDRSKWTRLRVDVRFPGVSTLASKDGRCTRLFDLVVDDVYLGPERDPQRVVVDASFLKSAEIGGAACDDREPGVASYAHPLDASSFVVGEPAPDPFVAPDGGPGRDVLPLHASLRGRVREPRAPIAGARVAWELAAHPPGAFAALALRLGFGLAGEHAKDALAVSLAGDVVTVLRRSPALDARADVDASDEWVERRSDEALYFLRKAARTYLAANRSASKEELVKVVCPKLREALASPDPSPADDALLLLACE